MTPKGKYPISVCLGTACYVRGAEKVLEEFQRQLEIKVGETTSDGLFSLNCLRCVGACGLAPVVTIAGKVYGRLTPEKVRDILSEYYLCGCVILKSVHVTSSFVSLSLPAFSFDISCILLFIIRFPSPSRKGIE